MSNRIVRSVYLTLAGALLASSAIAQPAAPPMLPRLILLDGQSAAIQSLAIDPAGKLSGEGVPERLTFDDLRRIELPGKVESPSERPPAVVELRQGGRVLAKSVTVADDACQVEAEFGTLAISLDAVRAIRLAPNQADAEFDKALAAPDANDDRLFLRVEEGKTSSVAGLVDSLTAEKLTFEAGGQTSEVPRAKIYGIVVAQPGGGDTAARCEIALRDGSVLAGDSLAVDGDSATVTLPAGGKLSFPWAAARRVSIRSSRVTYLSDLKPLAVEEQPLVTAPRPWRKDQSVSGGPLRLGSNEYEKGIGVHSRSLLTFAAEGKYDVLAATIGIDAATGGKGDCVFHLLADGQPLFTRRMRGTDASYELEVPIAGREQVTLLVEPGADLDLADHANWCDVRLIKNKQ